MADRRAEVRRETKETRVSVQLVLDGQGQSQVSTGVGFFDHMLAQLAHHSRVDLRIQASGDLEVGAHHVVEDVGIALGQALAQALGDKAGLRRYGVGLAPMDEALVLVALDLSGRPGLHYQLTLPAAHIGNFDTELAREFLQALVNHAALTMHVRQLAGSNTHHILESAFKSLGRALAEAILVDPRRAGEVPSTKGVL
jgi:imidazoleglycerol-phosphate dehydratase